jgi:hypothetical protein
MPGSSKMPHATPALFESAMTCGWTTDAARLDFSDYRNRQIWGPPDESGSRTCINRTLLRKPFPYTIEQRVNPYPNGEDADYGMWEQALDLGRSYLVGSTVPMAEFMRAHTSSMNEWQRLAYGGVSSIQNGCWCSARRGLACSITSPSVANTSSSASLIIATAVRSTGPAAMARLEC